MGNQKKTKSKKILSNQERFLKIDLEHFDLQVVKRRPSFGIVIPIQQSEYRFLTPLEKIIYFEILYRARYAEDRRKNIKKAYRLFYPDAWLVAIGYIMWEGIVQGLAWDSLKLIVKSVLEKLGREKLSPSSSFSAKKDKLKTRKRIAIEFGYKYVEYGIDGRKRYQMFIGLRRVYSHMSENERSRVLKSQVEKKPSASEEPKRNEKPDLGTEINKGKKVVEEKSNEKKSK